jgi:hypothetical protein
MGTSSASDNPPTPAPDHLASGADEIFELQKSFKRVSKKFWSADFRLVNLEPEVLRCKI